MHPCSTRSSKTPDCEERQQLCLVNSTTKAAEWEDGAFNDHYIKLHMLYILHISVHVRSPTSLTSPLSVPVRSFRFITRWRLMMSCEQPGWSLVSRGLSLCVTSGSQLYSPLLELLNRIFWADQTVTWSNGTVRGGQNVTETRFPCRPHDSGNDRRLLVRRYQ